MSQMWFHVQPRKLLLPTGKICFLVTELYMKHCFPVELLQAGDAEGSSFNHQSQSQEEEDECSSFPLLHHMEELQADVEFKYEFW